MVSFIKDEEVDLVDSDVCVLETLVQDLSSADNDLIFRAFFLPKLAVPGVLDRFARENCDRMSKVAFEHRMLLEG